MESIRQAVRQSAAAFLVFLASISMTPDVHAEDSPSSQDYFVFDKAPKVINWVPPDYPKIARENELEGQVVVKVTVDETGKVSSAEVQRSTAELFNEPSLTAVRQWRFEPAEQEGEPVKATIIVPLDFSLNRGGHERLESTTLSQSQIIQDDRPDVVQVCQLAIGVSEMDDYWGAGGDGPLHVLWNSQLRQFGHPSIFEIEKFGQPVVVVKKAEDLGDQPYLKFSRLAIEGDAANVEYTYLPEGIHCAVKFTRSEGGWEVKRAKVDSP